MLLLRFINTIKIHKSASISVLLVSLLTGCSHVEENEVSALPLTTADLCLPTLNSDELLTSIEKIVEIHPPSTGPYPYFKFLEGPVWRDNIEGGSLYFSDLGAPARIWQLTPPSTVPVLYLENSGSNGLALINDNHLIIADREQRRITQLNINTKKLVELIPANGTFKPNDVIVSRDNNMYFTASKSGFFHVSLGGVLSQPIKSVFSPNGIALSVDEKTLYVGDYTNKTVTTFARDINGDVDELSAKVFVRTQGDKVDGMTVDCAGNLYVGSTAGVEVFNLEGQAIGIIATGRSSNVAFGGEDRKTLYVTTPKLLKAIQLSVAGVKK